MARKSSPRGWLGVPRVILQLIDVLCDCLVWDAPRVGDSNPKDTLYCGVQAIARQKPHLR